MNDGVVYGEQSVDVKMQSVLQYVQGECFQLKRGPGNELEREKFTSISRIVITSLSTSFTHTLVQSLVHVEFIELLQHQSRLGGHIRRSMNDGA